MPDIFNPSEKLTSKKVVEQTFHPAKPVEKNQPVPIHPQTAKPPGTNSEVPTSDSRNIIHSEELKEVASETMKHPQDATRDLPEKLRTNPRPLGLFSHYCANPTGISFVNQDRDEKIILFIRRHFVTNIPWLVTTLILLLLPIVALTLFAAANFTLFSIPLELMIIMLCFYYLVIFNYALMKFIEWFYHVGIVTRKRMLDLDVNNILHHDLAETYITDIVDVSYSQQGFLQSFFNYGEVPIQTEAIKANFEFEAAPKPATIADIVASLRPHVSHTPYPKGESHNA